MPDRNLVRPGNPLDEIAQILQIEVVARIEPQTATASLLSCPDIRLDRPFAPGGEIPGIGLGVQLHPVGSALHRPRNHLGDGIDENRNPDSPGLKFSGHLPQKIAVLHRIPSGIGGDGVLGIGHERHLRRTHFEHQFAERRDRITLDIELGRQHFLQVAHVRITDMAGVGTGMHRNPLRSEALAVQCRTYHVGKIAAARIAHHGDLIDVHTQFCHKKLYLPKNDRQSVKLYPQTRTIALTFHYLCGGKVNYFSRHDG